MTANSIKRAGARINAPTPAAELKRLRAKATREKFELLFLQQVRAAKLAEPLRQYQFAKPRKWAFDFAFFDGHLNPCAIEIDGAIYTNGRHTRGKGFEADCEKLNEAALLGWTVLRFSTGQVKSGYAIQTVERWFKA